MAKQESILIIGASAAGVSAAKELRAQNPAARVTLIGDEPHPPYYRPILTRRITDDGVEQNPSFLLNKPEWYDGNNITLITGGQVTAISPGERKAVTADGRELPWDKLILAAGAVSVTPVPGAGNHENVFTLRTLDNARAAFRCQRTAKRIVIVGGGLLGLETASVLRSAGKEVSVVEFAGRILPGQLDPEGSALFEAILRRAGCPVFPGETVESFAGTERVTAVRLHSGREIPADMVVFSTGVRPCLDLAHGCDLRVNRGIQVNERMETSVPGIFACGDIAEFRDTPRLWMPALQQGGVAGRNAAGGGAVFAAAEYPASMTGFGTRIFSVGDTGRKSSEGEYTERPFVDSGRGVYRKLFFREGRLTGGVFVGESARTQALVRAVRAGMPEEEAVSLLAD